MNRQAERNESAAPSFEQRWRQRFTRFAADHEDDAGIAGWTPTGLSARVRQFSRVWDGDTPGALWLDAGCGAGTYVRLLQARRVDVLGLDYSALSIEKARRRDNEGRWLVGDATALPMRSGRLDGVLCVGVTQALSGSAPLLDELSRVVRPGGRVWVDGLNSWCIPHLVERLIRALRGRSAHVRYESPFRLRALMRARGLRGVQLVWLPILPARLQRWQPLLEGGAARWAFRRIPLLGALLSHSMILTGEVGRG